jgi:dihydroorotate dehydrogenase
LYSLIRRFLFLLDPEWAHTLTLDGLAFAFRIPGFPRLFRRALKQRVPPLPATAMGLAFPNPVGLAAGLDKNAACVNPLADVGFGWLELGTVTPRPQPGNPKKRLFRLPEQGAIINRMGFNSAGLGRFTANLARVRTRPVIGINLGKNADTPVERALDDYVAGMRAVYATADYLAINISSPNTANLRDLQHAAALDALLAGLAAERRQLAAYSERVVPIAIKIAPDLTPTEIDQVAEQILNHGMDAVIATNTTITRPELDDVAAASETGGLSGRPLKDLSTATIRALYARLQGRVPIIGVGGIFTAADAWEKLVAGADLVQLYSAFIFEGPGVVRTIVTGLAAKVREMNCESLAEAVAKARR